jgi:hypothetical protein
LSRIHQHCSAKAKKQIAQPDSYPKDFTGIFILLLPKKRGTARVPLLQIEDGCV